jgi:hypothetical protein
MVIKESRNSEAQNVRSIVHMTLRYWTAMNVRNDFSSAFASSG